MVLEIVSVLRGDPFVILGSSKLEIVLLEVIFDNGLLWVPLLSVSFLLDTICSGVSIQRAVTVS